jgi:hypothetical protein
VVKVREVQHYRMKLAGSLVVVLIGGCELDVAMNTMLSTNVVAAEIAGQASHIFI